MNACCVSADGSGGEGGGEWKGEGGEGGNDDTLVVSSPPPPPQSEVPSKTKGTAKKSRPKNKQPSSVEGRQETAEEGVAGESGEKEDDVPDETLLLTSPLPASTAAAAAVAGEGVGGLEDVPDETLLVTPRGVHVDKYSNIVLKAMCMYQCSWYVCVHRLLVYCYS